MAVLDRLAAEGQPEVVFTIQVPAGDLPVTLDYSTVAATAAAGSDFLPVAGTLTFEPAADPRTQDVAVPLADDAAWEPTEWFYLELSNATNVALPGDAPTYRATATVRDDDPRPALRVSDARAAEGDSGEAAAVFTVSLSGAADRPVTVAYSTADATATAPGDYTPASGTLVFEPGELTRTVEVRVRGDTADEANETFSLNLRAATVATIADARGVGTIEEDDDHRPSANVLDVTPDPRTDGADGVRIVFTEAVTGVGVSDFALTRDGGPNLLTAAQTLETTDGGVTWTLGNLSPLTRPAGRYLLTLKAAGSGVADLAGNALAADASDGWRTYASVAGRYVAYNNSAFDAHDPAANGADDAAIAPDKRPLLPGEAPTFANITGYSRGLNEFAIDVAGLPTGAGPTAADFAFGVSGGAGAVTSTGAPPPPSVTVRRGAGVAGADRVTLVFPDDSLTNAWLRVTLLATARTGLAAPDTFSFGNLVGDTADGPAAAGGPPFSVDARDVLATRRGFTAVNAAAVTNPADHNRDGTVNALDVALARANYSRALPPPQPAAPAPLRRALATDLLR